HMAGAFTGATKDKPGHFALAEGGTIFLDEIGETSAAFQVRMLRVIQEREIERVGGSKLIPIDVRIVATTNRDLKKEVENKTFREDLYYRLNVVPIHLPAIAERREDVPLLVDYFVKKYATENASPVISVSEKAMRMLSQRDWPGNVREIENAVERAVVMSGRSTEVLELDHFFFQGQIAQQAVPGQSQKATTLREAEKNLILLTLKENNNNRTKTADILEISVRTLRNKLNEYRDEGIIVD
ncbi:sigma-54-dependent Fis family transcriptional regulator, partial [candidate division KSB1 bacterium]|nr:sigma-54-dependent Fis family transcriptional regulator [candidate division KSB1 bacterium]